MDFSKVETEFRKLKGQFEAGALTEAEFKAHLQELMLQDEQGRWWMIGYETGQWYYHDGEKWVRDEPPPVAERRRKQMEALCQEGKTALEARDWAAAIEKFEAALVLEPNHPGAIEGLAEAKARAAEAPRAEVPVQPTPLVAEPAEEPRIPTPGGIKPPLVASVVAALTLLVCIMLIVVLVQVVPTLVQVVPTYVQPKPTPTLPAPGAYISQVVADTSAATAGLQAGDTITAVDGTEVNADHDLATLIGQHKPGDEVTLKVSRGLQESREVKVTLGEKPGEAGKPYLGVYWTLITPRSQLPTPTQ